MREIMPISRLPEYLRSIRYGAKDQKDVPVVDMGTIRSRPGPNLGMIASVLVLVLMVSGIGLYGYSYKVQTKRITIVSQSNEMSAEDIKSMLGSYGAEVLSIVEGEERTYEAKVSLRKNVKTLIETIKGRKEVKDAWLTDP